MKQLDIEKILNHAGCTKQEFAKEIGIPLEKLEEYCEGKAQMTEGIAEKATKYTGLLPITGGMFIAESEDSFNRKAINPENTFEASQETKDSLLDYINQGLSEIKDETVNIEIQRVETCVKSLKKPKISFAGQSDTGKSTLINALLGAEKMPAKWTPTTSIVVYIKHIDDRPSFMTEDVWIFGESDSGKWEDSMLNEEASCNKHLIKKGDFSLLITFGTHQNENNNAKIASSAVAFIDSPLLKNCDILDLPGFAANDEDDAMHKFNTQENVTDILIYLSRSNGFLQDRDLDYLRECIKSLRPAEIKGVNGMEKLENLFIIAAQAGAVNYGNIKELEYIIETRCKALCKVYSTAAKQSNQTTLLKSRTALTGYDYSEEDFKARFFTYEKDMDRLCKRFNSSFTQLAEKLPKAIQTEFNKNLKSIVEDSKTKVGNRVNECMEVLNKKQEYAGLVGEIKEKEPARQVDQLRKNNEIKSSIDSFCTESKQDIQYQYASILSEDNLVSLIDSLEMKNKKSDKQDFSSTVQELLSSKIQSILADKSNQYAQKIDTYLEDYSDSFSKCSDMSSVSVKFDSSNSFAIGLTSLGVLGASATWLATSFTAWSAITFGTLFGWGPILAVGGVVGIAIGAVIAGIVSLVKALTWKKDLANKIIKAYDKEEYINTVFTEVDKYWDDTQRSFSVAAEKVETDWQNLINEYESIADEKNIPILMNKIAAAKKGLDFFTKMPLPDIG